MRSIALVGMNGSIDFLCYQISIHPQCLQLCSTMSGADVFQIQPEFDNMQVRQLYLPDTNFANSFLADEGVAELTDYMPIGWRTRATE